MFIYKYCIFSKFVVIIVIMNVLICRDLFWIPFYQHLHHISIELFGASWYYIKLASGQEKKPWRSMHLGDTFFRWPGKIFIPIYLSVINLVLRFFIRKWSKRSLLWLWKQVNEIPYLANYDYYSLGNINIPVT